MRYFPINILNIHFKLDLAAAATAASKSSITKLLVIVDIQPILLLLLLGFLRILLAANFAK